jgi:hypothetical protein
MLRERYRGPTGYEAMSYLVWQASPSLEVAAEALEIQVEDVVTMRDWMVARGLSWAIFKELPPPSPRNAIELKKNPDLLKKAIRQVKREYENLRAKLSNALDAELPHLAPHLYRPRSRTNRVFQAPKGDVFDQQFCSVCALSPSVEVAAAVLRMPVAKVIAVFGEIESLEDPELAFGKVLVPQSGQVTRTQRRGLAHQAKLVRQKYELLRAELKKECSSPYLDLPDLPESTAAFHPAWK